MFITKCLIRLKWNKQNDGPITILTNYLETPINVMYTCFLKSNNYKSHIIIWILASMCVYKYNFSQIQCILSVCNMNCAIARQNDALNIDGTLSDNAQHYPTVPLFCSPWCYVTTLLAWNEQYVQSGTKRINKNSLKW